MSDAIHAAHESAPTVALQLSPSERFMRALALSTYVRQLAWQGAQRQAGARGQAAVVDRFLRQLYGADVAEAFRTSVSIVDE